MIDKTEYTQLKAQIVYLENELQNERESHSRTLGLLMQSEAVRKKIQIHAIINGAYNHLVTGESVKNRTQSKL